MVVRINTATREINVMEDDLYTVTQGTLANNTARAANLAAINNIITRAASEGKEVYFPPGTYEVHGGAIIINSDALRLHGTCNTIFLQYQLNIPVVHVGPPLGTTGAVIERILFDGFELKYSGSCSSGANALECVSAWMCDFRNIDIGDVNQSLSGRVSVPYTGIHLDGQSGVTPCFSNSWTNIRIKHFLYRGINADRPAFDAASTGSVWKNIYISGGDGAGQQDTSGIAGAMPCFFKMQTQLVIDQLNIEWLMAETMMQMEVCVQTEIRGLNIEGVRLKNASSADSGFLSLLSAHIDIYGGTFYNNQVLTANNVSAAALFRCYDDAMIGCFNTRVELTTKTTSSTPNFSVLRNMTGAGNSGVRLDLYNFQYSSSHGIDQTDNFTESAGNTDDVFGQLSDFNNTTPITLSDASQTVYAYHEPGSIRLPATAANRALTLARQISASDTCRIPRGVTRRVFNSGSGAGTVRVNNYEGTQIGTSIALASAKTYAFDGTNWIEV